MEESPAPDEAPNRATSFVSPGSFLMLGTHWRNPQKRTSFTGCQTDKPSATSMASGSRGGVDLSPSRSGQIVSVKRPPRQRVCGPSALPLLETRGNLSWCHLSLPETFLKAHVINSIKIAWFIPHPLKLHLFPRPVH